MTKQIGWLEETAEGTDLVETNTTTLNPFGLMTMDRPHPWEDFPLASVFQEDTKAPVDLVPGLKSVKFQVEYAYQHGWPWYYALGKKEHISATTDKFTLGDLVTYPIKSRTVYSRVDNDIVVAKGCKTKSFVLHAETPEEGQQPKPIWCTEELWGWNTATHAAVTAGVLAAPAGLTNVGAKGVENISVKTYAGNALANLRTFNITVTNMLDYHGGLGSQTPRGIKQLEGTKVLVDFIATLDGTASDLLSAARAAFSKGASQDFNFRIKFNSGATEYHDITIENLYLHAVKPMVYRNKVEAYSCAGEAMAYSTYEPISVTVIDGVEYQA